MKPCPTCGARSIYRGTYKSRYGYRYRRYVCTQACSWREDMEGNTIEVKRGRMPLAYEIQQEHFATVTTQLNTNAEAS